MAIYLRIYRSSSGLPKASISIVCCCWCLGYEPAGGWLCCVLLVGTLVWLCIMRRSSETRVSGASTYLAEHYIQAPSSKTPRVLPSKKTKSVFVFFAKGVQQQNSTYIYTYTNKHTQHHAPIYFCETKYMGGV